MLLYLFFCIIESVKIQWTKHAEVRQKEWERKLGITREEVEGIVTNPEQIVKGDMDLLIAQAKRRHGIIRVPFEQGEGRRKVITVYWTSKVEKYWKE